MILEPSAPDEFDVVAVLEESDATPTGPVKAVAYHFLPQSIQADLEDSVACERWQRRAAVALRAAFPAAEVTVSYEVAVPGCHDWLDIDGTLRPSASAVAQAVLDEASARMTVELARGHRRA
jgi:hypothetical protein